MQSLETFKAMTAVIFQFLQHNAQYPAGVTVTSKNRNGPDDMEIDALTKEGKSHKGIGKSKTDGQKTSCLVCGPVGHTTKDCCFKDTSKGNTPNKQRQEGQMQRRRKEQCERSHNSDRVDGDSVRVEPPQVRSRESPRMTLGTVVSLWMRTKMRSTKLDTSWQRSDTENHSTNPRSDLLSRT